HGLVAVLDGLTARVDTGCIHGVSWFANRLGSALTSYAANTDQPLQDALRSAIKGVSSLHPQCDLSHIGTPSAAVAIVRWSSTCWQYLLLGDTTVVMEMTTGGVRVVSDPRLNQAALSERKNAHQYAIGTPEKQEALLTAKRAELAARNTPGGYW